MNDVRWYTFSRRGCHTNKKFGPLGIPLGRWRTPGLSVEGSNIPTTRTPVGGSLCLCLPRVVLAHTQAVTEGSVRQSKTFRVVTLHDEDLALLSKDRQNTD